MRKIIYGTADGGIAIVHPIINTHPQREEITEAEAEQRAWDRVMRDVPDAINPRWVDASSIPADRHFRDAWYHDGSNFLTDIPKAREITKQRLRRERAPLMSALDVAYLRANEVGDDVEKTRITREKQRLREVTKLADAESDFEVLKELHA